VGGWAGGREEGRKGQKGGREGGMEGGRKGGKKGLTTPCWWSAVSAQAVRLLPAVEGDAGAALPVEGFGFTV
jgi:hypothetical protein